MSFLFRTFLPSSRRQRRKQPLGAEGSGFSDPSNGEGKNYASASVEQAEGSMYRNPYDDHKEDSRFSGERRRLANGSMDSEEGHELEQGEPCFDRARNR